MTEENGSRKKNRSLLDEIRETRATADKGREPRFFSSRMGTRQYSIAALLERIISEFVTEYPQDSDALLDADTESKRLQLILGVVDYVVGVESLNLSSEDKATIIRHAYTELFSYGPLDVLFDDDRVTTISLEGIDKAFVRYGHGELTPVGPLFEDTSHLRQIVRRLLRDAGTDFQAEEPLVETGLQVGKKRVCVNIASPPITVQMAVDLRVHQAQLPTLESMVQSGMMTEQATQLIIAIARSQHGLIVVGDTESGKTTLLAIIASFLSGDMVAVERAGEMLLPDGAERLVVQWGNDEQEKRTFREQVHAALAMNPAVILLDEVRADEAPAVAPLLLNEDTPRQLWSFRGPANSKRLISALGMLARRSDLSAGETPVQNLYRRLPFVITVRRRQDQLQLYSIGEWQFAEGSEYADYVELMEQGWEELELTGKRPFHELDLPADFFDKG